MKRRARVLATLIIATSALLGVPAGSQTKVWRIGLISGAVRGIDGCTQAVLMTARALKIPIPPSLLARADRVIE